jgi:hypothetical protein
VFGGQHAAEELLPQACRHPEKGLPLGKTQFHQLISLYSILIASRAAPEILSQNCNHCKQINNRFWQVDELQSKGFFTIQLGSTTFELSALGKVAIFVQLKNSKIELKSIKENNPLFLNIGQSGHTFPWPVCSCGIFYS